MCRYIPTLIELPVVLITLLTSNWNDHHCMPSNLNPNSATAKAVFLNPTSSKLTDLKKLELLLHRLDSISSTDLITTFSNIHQTLQQNESLFAHAQTTIKSKTSTDESKIKSTETIVQQIDQNLSNIIEEVISVDNNTKKSSPESEEPVEESEEPPKKKRKT